MYCSMWERSSSSRSSSNARRASQGPDQRTEPRQHVTPPPPSHAAPRQSPRRVGSSPPPPRGGAASPARVKRVVLRSPVVVALAPFGGDQALVFQTVERRIERPLRNFERVSGDLPDAEQHAVSVERRQRHGLQNQHVQRAGQKAGGLVHA